MVVVTPLSSPGRWTWTCHTCHLTIPLGATNRCLNCSHTFCAGVPKGTGKKAHKACGSTFDYVGWREWGSWRREIPPTPTAQKEIFFVTREKEKKAHCMRDCDFPSQCRWAPRLATGGVNTSKETKMAGSIVEAARDRAKRRAEKDAAAAALAGNISAGDISKGDRESTTPKSEGGLTFPTLDFKSFRTGLDENFFEQGIQGDTMMDEDDRQVKVAVMEDLLEEEDDDESIWDWTIGQRRNSTWS